ncbi:rhomboid-like protein [Streptacidiphilus rugosus]|uniref:rhomboid-like protein n=1 Tax=Streptacidiphilus rugosus TaxID=405783 RepID=UPI0006914AAD|nr:rhomboid-like protein [Streptacidiphilus rugosus]
MIRAAHRAWSYVRAAPGTYLWLLVLGLNTIALTQMSPRYRHWYLRTHSTNLAGLSHHPVKVLVSSAFWTQTPSFFFWFLMFNLFLVPAERWLGTLRWLLVVVLAHVGATLISEGTVRLLIDAHMLPRREEFVVDIGVSYGLSGGVGVLVWALARPWRWWYLGAATAFYGVLLGVSTNFTNLGHLCAYLIGVACYPLTRRRPGGSWTPDLLRRTFGRARRSAPVEERASFRRAEP